MNKYKRNWEYQVRKKHGLIPEPELKSTKAERVFIRTEVKKNIYEFAVTNNLEHAKQILELMEIYRIFEDVSEFILDTLHDVVPFISMAQKNSLVAEYVIHYTWHLPGPNENKITSRDILDLNRAVNLLSWMGDFNIMTLRVASNDAILKSLLVLFNTATAYGVKALQNQIRKSMISMKKGASSGKMLSVVDSIDFYLKQIAT